MKIEFFFVDDLDYSFLRCFFFVFVVVNFMGNWCLIKLICLCSTVVDCME